MHVKEHILAPLWINRFSVFSRKGATFDFYLKAWQINTKNLFSCTFFILSVWSSNEWCIRGRYVAFAALGKFQLIKRKYQLWLLSFLTLIFDLIRINRKLENSCKTSVRWKLRSAKASLLGESKKWLFEASKLRSAKIWEVDVGTSCLAEIF